MLNGSQREEDEPAPQRAPRRKAAPRIDPADLQPMGLHAAKRLFEKLED